MGKLTWTFTLWKDHHRILRAQWRHEQMGSVHTRDKKSWSGAEQSSLADKLREEDAIWIGLSTWLKG